MQVVWRCPMLPVHIVIIHLYVLCDQLAVLWVINGIIRKTVLASPLCRSGEQCLEDYPNDCLLRITNFLLNGEDQDNTDVFISTKVNLAVLVCMIKMEFFSNFNMWIKKRQNCQSSVNITVCLCLLQSYLFRFFILYFRSFLKVLD